MRLCGPIGRGYVESFLGEVIELTVPNTEDFSHIFLKSHNLIEANSKTLRGANLRHLVISPQEYLLRVTFDLKETPNTYNVVDTVLPNDSSALF
jgi:hypothetical protein